MENLFFSSIKKKTSFHLLRSLRQKGTRLKPLEGCREQLRKEMGQLKRRKESCRPQQMSGSRRSAGSKSSWLMKSSRSAGLWRGKCKLSLMWRPRPCWAAQGRREESNLRSASHEEELCKQDEESHRRELLEGGREAAPGQRGREEAGALWDGGQA